MDLRMLRLAFYYVSGPLNTATSLCQAKYSIFAIYDVWHSSRYEPFLEQKSRSLEVCTIIERYVSDLGVSDDHSISFYVSCNVSTNLCQGENFIIVIYKLWAFY